LDSRLRGFVLGKHCIDALEVVGRVKRQSRPCRFKAALERGPLRREEAGADLLIAACEGGRFEC
jgi:hypothetical protein